MTKEIAFVADVCIEPTRAGSQLLWRLFENWNREKITVIETNLGSRQTEKRIKKEALTLRFWGAQLLNSRLRLPYSAYLFYSSFLPNLQVNRVLDKALPKAIVTVAHGYTWITACRYAQAHQIPYFIFLHDDWLQSARSFPCKSMVERLFFDLLGKAEACFPISSGMKEVYQKNTSTRLIPILPTHARDSQKFTTPSRLLQSSPPYKIAYAGSLYATEYHRALKTLASILQKYDLGSVHVFSHDHPTETDQTPPNISYHAALTSETLVEKLNSDFDLLFSPQSFVADELRMMTTNFPSKLTDYSSTGLPCMIWAPEASSSNLWATENQCAFICSDPSIEHFESFVLRVLSSNSSLYEMGQKFSKAGAMSFDSSEASRVFRDAICSELSAPRQ